MNLTKQQEHLLKSLLNDDVWLSLLDDIEAARPIRPWKPSEKLDEADKNAQWIFESGIKRGWNDLVTIFRMT